jgi:hypothetical protein
MFPENHSYGHSAILRSHLGLVPNGPLVGRLQHGWQPGLGVEPYRRDDPWPTLIWNERNHQACQKAGFRHAVAIGSPYLYLPTPTAPAATKGPKSLVAFPFHGWEKHRLRQSMSGYAESLQLLAREGFGPITVCLYWIEHRDEESRSLFADKGFEVTTLGHRDGNPSFLMAQRDLLCQHAYSTSNRVSTAAFYALFERRKFFLHGPLMDTTEADTPYGLPFSEWQERHFGLLSFDRFADRAHHDIGEAELGLEHKRDAAQLREILGLGPGVGRRIAAHRMRGFFQGLLHSLSGKRARIKGAVEGSLASDGE